MAARKAFEYKYEEKDFQVPLIEFSGTMRISREHAKMILDDIRTYVADYDGTLEALTAQEVTK